MAGTLGSILLALITIGFIQKTQNYLPVWRNDLALWSYASQQTPDLPAVQIQRAISLRNAGQSKEAMKALDYALTHCNPDEIDRKRIEAKIADWTHSN